MKKDYTTPCYNAAMLPDLHIGDVVRLRKVHPCGSFEWRVVRLGADIGLECTNCKRRILLARRQLAQRVKSITSSESPPQEPTDNATSST